MDSLPAPQPFGSPAPPAMSAALLFAILESLPFRVYAYDTEWRCLLQNRVSIRDFGSFVGRHLTEIPLPPEIVEQWLPHAQRAMSGETSLWSKELHIEGEERSYRCLIAPIRSENTVHGVVGVDIDVTDLRRAEAALRDSEALYRLLAENSTDMIARHAATAHWLYVSPAVRTQLGYDPAELVGHNPFQIIHPDDRSRIMTLWEEMRSTGQPRSATLRARRADGQYIWIESAGRALPDHSTGDAREFVVSSRNVTRRIQTDQKLRQREAELAHLDRLSTLGQMASELAHELSQPLYAITNFADACQELIRRPGEPDRAQLDKWMTHIGQQARRAGEVLRRITHFVRKGELNLQPLDLNQAVRDVLAMLDFELQRQGVAVRLELADEPLIATADALLIEQVFVNLIRNAEQAMQATPPGQKVLSISTFRELPSGVGAAVSDTGPGLGEQPANHLFDSYVTTKPDGMGLGLAICRSTIEAHRGRIWGQNREGGGATFQFVLPAAHPPENVVAPPAPPA